MSRSRCHSHLSSAHFGRSLLSPTASRPSIDMQKSKTRFRKGSYFDGLNCNYGPSFYSKVFGSTLDEVILDFIQCMMKLFHKLYTCEQVEEEVPKFPSAAPTEATIGDYREYKDAATMVSEILEAMGIPPEVASEMVQTSILTIQESKPSLASKMLQTSSPEMVSEILQTLGLSAELASQIVQTSFASLPRDPSYVRPIMSSKVLQTSAPDLRSGMVQTSSYSMFKLPSEISEPEPIPSRDPSSSRIPSRDPSSRIPSREPSREPSRVPSKSKSSILKDPSSVIPSEKEPSAEVFTQPSSVKELQSSVFKISDLPPEPPLEKPQKCDCCPCLPCPEATDIHEEPKKTKCSCCQCDPCPEEPPEVPRPAKKCACCKCFPCPAEAGQSEVLPKAKSCICERGRGESEVLPRTKTCICERGRGESSVIKHKKVKICKCYDCSAPVQVVYKTHCICKEKSKSKCKCKRASPDASSYLTFENGDNSGSPKDCCSHTSYRIHHF